MNEKRKLLSVIAILLIIATTNLIYKWCKLKKCNKYSVARVIGGAGGTGRGASIEYEYKFGNSTLISSDIFDGSYNDFLTITEENKKRYFISVSCEKNTITRVIWSVSVPDTLKYIPKNGWESVPYGLDKHLKKERSWWDKIIHP